MAITQWICCSKIDIGMLILHRRIVYVGIWIKSFKLDVRVKSLHTEYSNKLTSFALATLKGFKAYEKLFTQLEAKDTEKHSNGEQSINIKHILTKIKANVVAADISCFFINRHDVCTFVNLCYIVF